MYYKQTHFLSTTVSLMILKYHTTTNVSLIRLKQFQGNISIVINLITLIKNLILSIENYLTRMNESFSQCKLNSYKPETK